MKEDQPFQMKEELLQCLMENVKGLIQVGFRFYIKDPLFYLRGPIV